MQKDRVVGNLRKQPMRGAEIIRCFTINSLDGSQGEQIGEWRVKNYEHKLSELGEEIYETAQGHTDEELRAKKFKVICFNDSDVSVGSWTMQQIPVFDGKTGLLDEEASPEGMVRQAIRHNEQMFLLTQKANERVLTTLMDQCELLNKRITSMEKRQDEVTELARILYVHGEDREKKDMWMNRIDHSLRILSEEVLPAACKEFGILPKNFKLGRDLSEYEGPEPPDNGASNESAQKDDSNTD